MDKLNNDENQEKFGEVLADNEAEDKDNKSLENFQEDKIETVEITDPSSGFLLKTVTLRNGVPDGELLIYDEEGNVSHKLNFTAGILSGNAEFYEKGELTLLTKFQDGTQNGPTIMFVNGIKTTEMCYKNGVLDGEFISYDNQGNIVRKANYVDGKLDGECTVYYPDGTVMEHSIYKQDKLDGEVQKFYPSGVVREISNFENGKPIGTIDTYDLDGDLQSSEEV